MREAGRGLLQPGDLLTRFEGATVDGRELRYEQLWQHRNVMLFLVSAELARGASSRLAALEGRLSELKPPDTSLVISDHPIDGVPMNSVVIADRWAEVVYIAQLASDPGRWPSIDDLVEWVEFIRMKCPECPP
jgi:hypothetical protein